MNLTKYFNFKYLLQNLKKSKGILTVLVLIIPVLTTLILISRNTNIYNTIIFEFELASINILGMYIIPFIISVILGGYIFKRKSVDFINSMPMNRRTIYFTNFIGGLLVIVAIQCLSLVTNLICARIFTQIFIPTAMIFDSFIVMLISYIFVYSACMLAQTVSGNVFTQIVVVALILFLVPFMHITFSRQVLEDDAKWIVTSPAFASTAPVLEELAEVNYTMPFRVISLSITR